MKTMDRFAAYVGIDWADTKHDVCVKAAGEPTMQSSILEHTPEAIAAWADSMRHRYDGQPVAICLELDKGPLVYALREVSSPVVHRVGQQVDSSFVLGANVLPATA